MEKCENSIEQSKDCIKNTNKSEKKVGKSSRHLNVLRRRLKKWTNESDRGSIVIETLTHPMKDSKALISLCESQMNEETKRKSKVGDLMLIHSANLNLFIKRLQKIRDNLNDNTLDGIIVDKWDINSEQSK